MRSCSDKSLSKQTEDTGQTVQHLANANMLVYHFTNNNSDIYKAYMDKLY